MNDERETAGERRNAILRSGFAAAAATAAHVAIFAWLATHSLATEPPDAVQGVPIDLDLLAVAPPRPQHEAAPAAPAPPPSAQPTADPQPTPKAADPSPSPTPEPSPPTPESPQPSPTPSPDPPTPQSAPQLEAVAAPPPKPRPRPTPRTKLEPHKRERGARQQAKLASARRGSIHEARAASNDNRQGAAQQRVSSGADVANWRGEVLAHISEFKPSSSGGAGTALVAFTIDRSGRVLSARLARSSGDSSLDAASVAMVRRASPVPAPPPELGARVSLTVPVRYR